MDALLGLIGIVGIIYSIGAFIKAQRNKKPLKKPGAMLLLSLILFITGVSIAPQKDNAGIGPSDSTITLGADAKSQPKTIPEGTSTPEPTQMPDGTPEPTPAPSPKTAKELREVRVTFIDVGQADSILIQTPEGKSMLIDAGNNADSQAVVSYLKNQGISKIDILVGTHPHEDHIGGLDDVIGTFDIGAIYMPKVSHTTKTFEDVLLAVQNKGLKVTTPVAESTFGLGEAEFTILAPNSSSYEGLNNYSIVFKMEYGDTSFLFTGDAEDILESEMINKGYDLSVNVLKVGHHGSSSSTTQAFLDAVDPAYAVIMVGAGNDYGHPHKAVMERLQAKGVTVYRTDESGSIVCTSNGKDIKFNVPPGTYAVGEETSKATTTPKPSVIPSTTKTPGPSPSASEERIVYYTPKGKSYHFLKNCSTLSRSKTILEGKLSDVIKLGKDDPCNRCAGGK